MINNKSTKHFPIWKLCLIGCLFIQINISAQEARWNNILNSYVSSEGVVDYASLYKKKSEIQAIVDEYAKKSVTGLTNNEKLSYYINVYNINTILKILQHYPIKSIKDISNGKVWDENFIVINNQKRSLNYIENEIIRKQFKDHRIHFALNCAAKSCPPLLNEAFSSNKLDIQMASCERKFLKNHNVINNNHASISKIFDWYSVDFGDIKKYLKSKGYAVDLATKVTYMEYNWALNGK